MRVDENPWDDDYRQFTLETVAELKVIGREIGADSEVEGPWQSHALDVMRYYSMLTRSYDPMTHHLLRTALSAYKLAKLETM